MVHGTRQRVRFLSVIAVLLLSHIVYTGSTEQPVGSVTAAVSENKNIPPVVEVVPDVSSGKAPLQVHFDGDAHDEDGLISIVEWDFEGDGSFEVLNNLGGIERPLLAEAVKQGLQKEFIYTNPGIYHALVRATDDRGESSVSSVTIQVYSDIPWLDVTASNKEEFTYMARARYEVFFKDDVTEKECVKFQIKDASISYQLRDQIFAEVNKAKGVPSGNQIIYQNVYENIDVRYTIYEDVLLEEFIVYEKMDLPVFEQEFTIDGVEYVLNEDGSIGFYNGETLVFSIPKPLMYELDNPQNKSYGLHYEIIQKNSTYVLKKVIDDEKWLKKAKYPIVIDSSTQGEIADPWEQQGLTPYGQYFENLNEYVDPLTGHLTIRHTDYHLSGRGLNLTVTRVYSTVVAYKEEEKTPGAYIPIATYQEAPTDLGSGWSLDFPWLEIKDDQPGKYLHLPQGVQVRTNFQNGVWVNETYGFTMYQQVDNTYVRYRNNGIGEEFDTEGRITSITDLNGNSLTFAYMNELLYSITDTVGRVLTFTYAGDKLVEISDGTRTITYNYSGDKLVSVQDPLGRVTTYEYLSHNSFLITGVHYPAGGFSSYEYAAILPDSGKLAPYKASQLNDGITAYYVYKVDSSDTVTWTSPQDINAVTVSSGRPCVLQKDDGSLVMYFKDKYVWTETVWKCAGGECWEETITHTEYWIKRSISTDQHHWSTPENVFQVKSTTGNPVVIEKLDGSYIVYYKDQYVWTEQNCYWEGCPQDCQYVCETITHTEYWIYRRTSSDGLIWQSSVKFQQTDLNVRDISVIQKQDSTYLMCYTDKVNSSYYIRQKTSPDGVTWSAPSNVILVDNQTGNPALLQRDSSVLYQAYRKGSSIYILSNSGSGWSSPVQSTTTAQGDPALLDTGTDIIILYKGLDGYFYRISSPDGSTWSSPSQMAPQKPLSNPSAMRRTDRLYRVVSQSISSSAVDLVKVVEFSYEGDSNLTWSSDVLIRDEQTLQSSMHFEYDSKGRTIERISRDAQGIQTQKVVYTYNGSDKVVREDVYAGNSQEISCSIITGYDDHGNTVYTRGPGGAESFYSYVNTNSQNQFIDSKGVPIPLFTNQFYTNNIPSECHTLVVGEAFINKGKVQEVYYKYDLNGNITETRTLFPTRNYAVFSGVFDEIDQTTFTCDLTGLTITDGILVISSIAVPYTEPLYETRSEPGKGYQNTGVWQGKYFLADYLRCATDLDCYTGQIKIGPFEHYPGSPDYTGYTLWIEDNTQYVKTSYSQIVNEYCAQIDYKINTEFWITITSNMGSGTTSTVIPAFYFVEGPNTLQFHESNTYNTRCEWTLYLDQGSTPEVYITTYTHDRYGNLTSVTNAEGHTTSFGYSGVYQYAYLTSRTDIVDGEEITVSATYDFSTGNQISRTCACGSVTDYEYDILGRLTRIIYPLITGEQVRAEYEICYDDISNTVTLYNEIDEKTVRYYDGLERMVKEEIYKDTMVWAQWQYEYNYLDKPTEMIDPLQRVYKYEYDSLGRVTELINPDQSYRTMEYDDVASTVTLKDENQHKKVYTFSWTGTPVSVKEYYGSDYYFTEYNYDKEGNLIQMIDPEQNITEYIYDSVFGITAVIYPDLTEQHFTYDAVGNIIERTDQNGNYIAYEYDALSQLKEINYQDTQVSFTYDSAGNKTSMVTPDVTTLYTYDSRNRLTQLTTIIDGTLYPLEYAYDAASNITQITYPEGITADYTYSLNQVESIQDYASFTYLPDGNLDEILYSNGVTTTFGYDSRGRIQNIHAYTSEDLLDLVYAFDAAGNITGIQNNFRTATEEWVESTESYTYDDLNRLISASNRFGALSYTYDSKKRLSVTENGQNIPYMYDYDLLLSAGEQIFTYDSNGNTLTKSSESQWVYHYNNANQLTHVDRNGQPFSNYLYDGDGNRIKKTEMNEDLQDFITTTYICSGLDVLYEVNTMGTALYIYGPSGRIAKQTTVNNETNTFYYTKDHLESTRLVTDSNGTPLTSVEYYPFGRHEYSGSLECNLFTGKEKDATGLSYFGARYYDPETGRFLTRDPYTFLPDDLRILSTSAEDLPQWLLTPQRFNRFSYAGNNPLKYKDPTGLSFSCIDPECQELLEEKENEQKEKDQPAQQGTSLVQEQEKCKKKCMRMGNVRRMLERRESLKTRLFILSAGNTIVCGIFLAWLGPVGVLCASLFFVTELFTYDDLSKVEDEIRDLGCGCVL